VSFFSAWRKTRLWNNLYKLFGTSIEAAIITSWSNPLGIEYATGTIYTALRDVQPKVFDKFSLEAPILA